MTTLLAAADSPGPSNKLDLVEGTSFLPWDLRTLGASFEDGRPAHNQSVAARCRFTLRRGFDALERVDYGRVTEGAGDVAFNLRAAGLAFHLGASNLTYKAGSDAPLAAADASLAAGADAKVASLKVAVAQEFAEDQYVAASYDLIQKKPELAFAWSGETFTEKAALAVNLDPVDGVCRLRAAVSFPGPEWREDVYDELTGRVEEPRDDGGRHSVWVAHEARRRQPMAATRVGARLDLGRLLNFAADYFDYNLEWRVPALFWKVPLSQRLYNLVIPAEDENQERYRLRGLCLEFAHDFERGAPAVGVSKRIGGGGGSGEGSGRATLMYDVEERAASAQLRMGGVVAGVTMTRAAGAGWRDWSSPSLTLAIEPLAFL